MNDNTSWTPSAEDNLLGITDKELINEYEAKGIAQAEIFILNLDEHTEISVPLILQIHKIIFTELYDWAGKYRSTQVVVGQLIPPAPKNIPYLFYQFINNLNYKLVVANTEADYLDLLVFSHYEFVRIYPFNNGNGRTGRLLMNLICLKIGYQPLKLYKKQGDDRAVYISAMREADKGDFEPLKKLIKRELIRF